MFKRLVICGILTVVSLPASAFSFSDMKDKISLPAGKDERQKEQEYLHKVKQEDAKDVYKKKILDRTPTGYMTVEQYEMLSIPKDKRVQDIPIPKPTVPGDMKYVPQSDYEIARYNNPPGSPEISFNRDFKKKRQQNAQGIVSPDYRILVYPSLYYYPKNGVVATDLFVIPLAEHGNALSKIKRANVMHRDPNPILSTVKDLDNFGAFHSLTPVDFNPDGSKLLVKEKVGSSDDGIWQTHAIVYDFQTETSYRLTEVRDAIVYYWNEYKHVNLNDYRWDIFPLGFANDNPERIIVAGYAYTGSVPIFLGNWSVDLKGERSQLVSLRPRDVSVSMNGVKMVKAGYIPPSTLELEQKQAKHEAKLDAKAKKKQEKSELKGLKEEYEANLKKINKEHNYIMEQHKIRSKIEGSTSTNDSVELIEQALLEHQAKTEAKEAKAKAKQEAKEQKRLQKEKEKAEKANGGQPVDIPMPENVEEDITSE